MENYGMAGSDGFGITFNGKESFRKDHFFVGCRVNGATKSFQTKEEALKFLESIFEAAKAEGGEELAAHVKSKTDLIKITVEARPLPLNGVEVEPSKPTGESATDFINGLKVKEGGKPK